jgi:hypothetical protein
MAPIRSVGRIFKVAAVTGGLLMLACPQARAASANNSFTESWQQTEKCEKPKGSSSFSCDEFTSGKFSGKVTILETTSGASGTLSPSLLTSGTAAFDISLAPPGGAGSGSGPSGSGSGSSSETGAYYHGTINSADGWTIKGNSKKATATRSLYGPKCKNSKFKYETIELTITDKPELTISVTGTTGFNSCGDQFADSLDAENFDGEPTGPVTGDWIQMFLQIDFPGSFNFNDADNLNVSVTGTVKTKPFKFKGSSINNLSNVNIKGTLQP